MKLLNFSVVLLLFSCSTAPGPVIPKSKVERQMIGLLEKFDRWDENGDGELVLSELKQAEVLTGRKSQKIIDFYDTNHSKSISLPEAQLGFYQKMQKKR